MIIVGFSKCCSRYSAGPISGTPLGLDFWRRKGSGAQTGRKSWNRYISGIEILCISGTPLGSDYWLGAGLISGLSCPPSSCAENIGTPSAYWFFTHRIPGSLHFTCVFDNPILVGSSKCCSRYSAGPISGLSCLPSSCAENSGTPSAYWFFTHRIPGSLHFTCVFDNPILVGSSKCCSRWPHFWPLLSPLKLRGE